MQQTTHILVVTTHEAILAILLRLINQREEWEALGADSQQSAEQILQDKHFDLLLLGSGLSETAETALAQSFRARNPQGKVVMHYGGGSGLLYNEIQGALASR